VVAAHAGFAKLAPGRAYPNRALAPLLEAVKRNAPLRRRREAAGGAELRAAAALQADATLRRYRR